MTLLSMLRRKTGFSLIEVVLAIGIFPRHGLGAGGPTGADTAVGRRGGEDRRSLVRS